MARFARCGSRVFNASRIAPCSSATGLTAARSSIVRHSSELCRMSHKLSTTVTIALFLVACAMATWNCRSARLTSNSFEVLVFHLGNEAFEDFDFVVADNRRCQSGGLSFEKAARFGQFERADVEFRRRAGLHSNDAFRPVGDVDTRSVMRFHETANFQRDHRFADRRAADLMLFGEVSFRGEALAAAIAALLDGARDSLRNLLIELLRLGGRSVHGTSLGFPQ